MWHVSVVNNVTSLGIGKGTPFRLRHGLTMEHDGLISKISDETGQHFDLIGRAVVLAFRLSGIKGSFPSIVTQREVVEATAEEDTAQIKFKKLNLSAEDRLKHFKGERWGTGNLLVSTQRSPRIRTRRALLQSVRTAIVCSMDNGGEAIVAELVKANHK